MKIVHNLVSPLGEAQRQSRSVTEREFLGCELFVPLRNPRPNTNRQQSSLGEARSLVLPLPEASLGLSCLELRSTGAQPRRSPVFAIAWSACVASPGSFLALHSAAGGPPVGTLRTEAAPMWLQREGCAAANCQRVWARAVAAGDKVPPTRGRARAHRAHRCVSRCFGSRGGAEGEHRLQCLPREALACSSACLGNPAGYRCGRCKGPPPEALPRAKCGCCWISPRPRLLSRGCCVPRFGRGRRARPCLPRASWQAAARAADARSTSPPLRRQRDRRG